HRHQPLPGPRLRRGDRAAHGAAGRLERASARGRAGRLPGAGGALATLPRVKRALGAAVAVVLLGAAGARAEDIKTIPARPGVTQSFLLLRRVEKPVATLILFAGGNGALNLSSGQLAGLGGNFLVRNRGRFAEYGFMVAVPDAPSDHTSGLTRFRSTAEHAADVRALIAALRGRAPGVPVWVIGTSMGTVSAANAAARLREGGPDGVVLT